MLKLTFERLTEVAMPCKAHNEDAGIDFRVPYDLNFVIKNGKDIKIGITEVETKDGVIEKTAIEVSPHKSIMIPLGVKSHFDEGYALVFFNRSGIASKKHLLRGACVVDSGYTGCIILHLENVSDSTQYILPGEKIVQALLLPVPKVEITEGKVENNTVRGEGGFGSTGS